MSKSIRLSEVRTEMYVGIIGVWAVDSEGLFSLTGVKCDFRLYQVTGERASKVICSIGSRSQRSDFILLVIWHSIITAWWPPWPYHITLVYFANAPFSQSWPNPPPPTTTTTTSWRRILVAFHGRYFLSWWHFDVPRHVCQSSGNLSRWIHGGLSDIFQSRHIIHIFFTFTWSSSMTVSPLNMWPWICLPPYVHASWKDEALAIQITWSRTAVYRSTAQSQRAHSVFFCEDDGQGGSSRTLCRRCLLSPEL